MHLNVKILLIKYIIDLFFDNSVKKFFSEVYSYLLLFFKTFH